MPGCVLSATVTKHVKGIGNGAINVVRAGHLSKGDRAVDVQLCLANGSMMVVNQPEEYSDAEVAKHAVTSKIGRRSEKRFAK